LCKEVKVNRRKLSRREEEKLLQFFTLDELSVLTPGEKRLLLAITTEDLSEAPRDVEILQAEAGYKALVRNRITGRGTPHSALFSSDAIDEVRVDEESLVHLLQDVVNSTSDQEVQQQNGKTKAHARHAKHQTDVRRDAPAPRLEYQHSDW